MDDMQIINLYLNRSEKAISETSAKYENYLGAISFNIVHKKEDSEECVNDTYFKAWNTIPPQKPNSFRIFLGRITRNLSIDCYKKKYAKKRIVNEFSILLSELDECIPSISNTEKEFEDKEIAKIISHYLQEQSKEKQLFFMRRYWFCDSIKQIANRYNCSESKVKSSLFHTRKILKEYLEKEGIEI